MNDPAHVREQYATETKLDTFGEDLVLPADGRGEGQRDYTGEVTIFTAR